MLLLDEPLTGIDAPSHGVHTYVESAAGRDWELGEPRTSRIVIIGKDLESERWRDELARCVAG